MVTDIVQKSIVLSSDKSRLLLLKRSATDSRRPSQWDFPGGMLDDGETLEAGILREIVEETGIIAKNPRLFFSKTEPAKWVSDESEHSSNVVRLYYFVISDSEDVTLSNEHTDFKWISLHEALNILGYPRHKEVVQYLVDNNLVL